MSLLSFFGLKRETLATSPSDDFWYEPALRRTAAGINVNENVAFSYSVCWAATRLLAGTAGWLPFNLYKRKPAGGAEIDSKHRVHRMIHDQPNNDMGAMMFRARGVNHQVNWGNTYAEIVRNMGGLPDRLEPIHPSRIPPQNIKRENGRIVYYVNRTDARQADRIEQEDMFHVPSIISDDGIIGKGVVTAAREAIGKAIGTQRRGASAMNHGGAPPLALKGAKFKTKEDREDYRRQINEVHGGPENAGKWLILPQDTEVQMLGFNLADSQFIESEHFDIEEISRWYGVPPHLVGHLLRATFNNIEELGISFVKYSLILWLKLWEQEVWRKLLTKAEQETHYAKFVVDALERGNLATRTEAGVKKFFNGLFTLNEWAEQEDMNPVTETAEIDGKTVNLGDVRFVQQAMIPLAMAAKGEQPGTASEPPTEPPKEETPPEEPRLRAELTEAVATLRQEIAAVPHGMNGEAQELRDELASLKSKQEASQINLARAMALDVMGRMVSVEINGVKRVAEKPEKFTSRLAEFYDRHAGTMRRNLSPAVSAWIQATGSEKEAEKYIGTLVESHVAESMRQLDALLDCTADELAGKVDECVSKWHDERVQVTL